MHPGYSIGAVWLHRAPVDFRKQAGGLAAIVEGELRHNLFAPALFVFTNRRRNSIKVLYWDRNGFCLWQKRLEQDRFAWPAADATEATCQVSARQLQWLLEGFDPWHEMAHKVMNYIAIS